jgi:flagellar hook-associated protein 2
VSTSSSEYLSVTARDTAGAGSYQMTVMALAQQQKDVSVGYASKAEAVFGTGNLSLTVGGVGHSIAIDAENNSLEGMAKAINDANLGVGATIINDGTESPYRLVLTGSDTSQSFSLDDSGLSGGTAASLTMETSQTAQQAHVVIDGIDIYSNSNSIDSSIAGLNIELLKADPVARTTVGVTLDTDAAAKKIRDFAGAYNDIVQFISDQRDSSWGNDPSFRAVKGQLQSFLVSAQGGGTYNSLSQLGFETQRDGTLKVNETKLNEALSQDYEGVVQLFVGSTETSGVAAQLSTYLDSATDLANGFYAGRKTSTDASLRQIDQRILSQEARLEQKETTLRAQFSAMEQLVSSLNAQGGYLMQQLAATPKIGGGS